MTSASLMYDAEHPKSVLCDNLEGWGGEGGEKRVQDGGDTCIHVYLWLIHTDIWQKPSQYCKVTILQL